MIKFAFQNWNVEYDWWCPNTVPHDFVVDGVKTLPVTHDVLWFDNIAITPSFKDYHNDRVSKAFASSAVKSDVLYGDVCYTKLDKVAGKEKYIFPILIRNADYFLSNKQGFDLIDPRVFQDVHEGRARIIVIFLYEGTSGHKGRRENDFKILDSWCKKYNLNSDQVYYINANLMCQQLTKRMNFTAIPINTFIPFVPYVPDTISEFKPHDKKNLFLSYNRNIRRPHRTILLCELIRANLLDRGLVSYGNSYVKNSMEQLHRYDRFDLDSEAKILDSMIPIEIDYNLVENCPAHDINLKNYELTFLSVVAESLWDKGTLFFSEKTWKTIAAGHPFMLVSSPGMLKALKAMGFYTYDSFWSEAYDELETIDERIRAVIIELQKLSLLDNDKLIKLRNDMRPIIEHNQQHFRSMWEPWDPAEPAWHNRQERKLLLDCIKPIWNSIQ